MHKRISRIEPLEKRKLFSSGLLKDIASGADGSSPFGFTAVGQQIFFFARETSGTFGLYKTQGTPGTTVRVADAGIPISTPYSHAGTSTIFYYASHDYEFGPPPEQQDHIHLYRSDGTAAGTYSLTDNGNINFNITWSYYTAPRVKALNASAAVFTWNVDSDHNELFTTDGTVNGTSLLADPAQGTSGVPMDFFTSSGNQVYFTVGTSQLWKTDGTGVGTSEVFENPNGDVISDLVSSGSEVYYLATSVNGWKLWGSNGTASGTVSLTDGINFVGAQDVSGQPLSFSYASVGNKLYFSADHNTLGLRLWQSDGTASGTSLVDTSPGAMAADAIWSVDAWQGGLLFFQTNSGQTHLMKMTLPGTIPQAVAALDSPGTLISAQEIGYFNNFDPAHGWELWSTDGTPLGTHITADDMSGADGNLIILRDAIPLGRSLIYAGQTLDEGIEPRRAPVTEITSIDFQYDGPRQQMVISFADPIDRSSFVASDIDLHTTGISPLTIPATQLSISFNANNTQAVVTYTGAPNGALPDGNWVVGIAAGAFDNSLGVSNFTSQTQTFFTLTGDANRDKSVDLLDMIVFANNWLSAGKTFTQGDFNYDGSVNARDLTLLAHNWQVKMTPTGPSLALAPPVSIAPSGPAPATYLSDLSPVSATNGWGTYEKDHSNGEARAGDGKAITLNGVKYNKGLGVHAGSTLVYNLDGRYSHFLAGIGVDDEVGTRGSVVFQVYADNKKIYDSGKMTGSSATQSVSLDVSGVKQLKLVVTDSGNGRDFDHADWANARLVATTVQTPAPTPLDTSKSLKIVDLMSLMTP